MKFGKKFSSITKKVPRLRFALWPIVCPDCKRVVWLEQVVQTYQWNFSRQHSRHVTHCCDCRSVIPWSKEESDGVIPATPWKHVKTPLLTESIYR